MSTTYPEVAERIARFDVPPPLQLDNVSKRFAQGDSTVEALKNVSLTIESGDFIAIMGASGSGKSTLLHITAGLTAPDEGSVVIDGTNILELNDKQLTHFRRRRIGLIFQAFNLIPTLTAEDNILLPLLTDGSDRIDYDQLQYLLDRLGLASRRKHRPDALSGGEQQRVAIARAIISDPALVLADEPTGSLDSVSGENICRLLRELCDEQRRTIVVVTHEAAVAAWAKKIVVMKDGRIVNQFETAGFKDANALAAEYQCIVNSSSRGLA